jgi:hypothetical protein
MLPSKRRIAAEPIMTLKPRRLLTVGHSYVVGINRRLAHAMQQHGRGRWEILCVAPTYFHGRNDLRPVTFAALPDEACPVRAVPAYLTRLVHLFGYSWPKLCGILQGRWDVVHAWEEPYIFAGAQIAALHPPEQSVRIPHRPESDEVVSPTVQFPRTLCAIPVLWLDL